MDSLVRLVCVRVSNKLRVRICPNQGYNPEANCQFPRDIRVENREYTVPSRDITFLERANRKFYYTVRKTNVKVISSRDVPSNLKVYQDESPDCVICMSNEKDSVFAPCGHFYCCNECATKIVVSDQPCPICRTSIQRIVDRSQVE